MSPGNEEGPVKVYVLYPSTGKRLVVRWESDRVDVSKFLTNVSGLLGHPVTHLTVKCGAPERGSFAKTHPGWDERIRMTYQADSGVVTLSLYKLNGEVVADVVVDEHLVPEFKNYPYF